MSEPKLSDSNEFGKRKTRQAARDARVSAAGRDCNPIRDVKDLARRERGRLCLRSFIETYNPDSFKLAWSEDQLSVIARIEEAALHGALFAFAMPRGSGKTSICRMAALWAVSYAHCRYVFVIGATAAKAQDTLAAVKVFMRFLPAYSDDFPEISQPVQALGGVANRAAGQLCDGQPTMMQWAVDGVVLPTVRPPENWPRQWALRSDGMVPTSGSILGAAGLTGEGIRGSVTTLTTGEQLRPDLVLIDDPQTPESARSATQNFTREQLISADVLGMAGPGKTISAVMPCTVISPGDMIDRVLDRAKHPLWRGERTRMLRTMPSDMEAWEKYFEVYRACAQRQPPDFAEANAHYERERGALDAGAEASWPARKLDWELSAIQHAMHLYARDVRSFMAEYQNDPLPEIQDQFAELTADQVAAKLNRLVRCQAPPEAVHQTAFIDVQKDVLFYAVCAWKMDFTGFVLDYGTYPEQKRAHFSLRDLKATMSGAFPGKGLEGTIYAGLESLTAELARRHRLDKVIVDANWGDSTGVVYQFWRHSGHGNLVLPSHGRGIGAAGMPMAEWPKKPGEKRGLNWLTRPSDRGRHIVYDTNYWKTFCAARLATGMGDKGCLSIFGDKPELHRLFADHVTAEYRVRTKGRGREVDEWRPRPNRENHWLDCLVGCCVAASTLGVALAEVAGGPRPARKLKTWAEMQARARGER